MGAVPGRSTRSLGCMSAEYLEATPQSRRRAGLVFVGALVLGVVLIEALDTWLEQSKALPMCEQLTSFRWLWATVWAALGILCLWVARVGQQSLKLNQWPLPGTWLLRRTLIHRGKSAKWRALAMLGWSVAALVGSGVSWYVGDSYVARVESQRCATR